MGWRGQDARDADARRRPPMPPDIARMALWLAADDSEVVTGQYFVVDGGAI